jgi:D-alanyl-D-alanine carboxypeptidase
MPTSSANMTSKTCILLAVCALWPQTALAAPLSDLAARLEAHIESFASAGQFTGSVLIASGGRVLLSKGYGMANREWSIPNTPRTKFRLGSVTKQFTATAIMQLETKGALSVDDPISRYVPDSPPSWKDITIQNLLTHTSGIHDYTAPPHPLKMRDPLAPAELVVRLESPPLDFPPGTKFNYSNSGYAVLGYIIEKISGQTYESYIKQHIFEPAGMDSSGYDHPQTILEYRASGYENRNGILTRQGLRP